MTRTALLCSSKIPNIKGESKMAINAKFLALNASGIYEQYNWETVSGQVLRPSGTQTVEAALALLEAAIGGASVVYFVADIAERDALTSLNNADRVFVRDASADPAVNSGWAMYIWDNEHDEFVKYASEQSLAISFDWTSIIGRPTSSPAQIDAAVAASHTHTDFAAEVFTVSATEPTAPNRTPFWFQPA
jgi:hypothetical protein